MKSKTSKSFIQLVVVIFLTGILFSCNSYRRVTYINPDEGLMDSIYLKKKPIYLLQPGDIMYFRVKSPNEETDRIFNKTEGGSSQMGGSNGNPHLFGYPISDQGEIEIPVIGAVKISGLSILDAKKLLEKEIFIYIKEFSLELKLYNFEFVVMGEVGSPGHYTAPMEEMNILEALAMAGEATYYGKRENVLVVRQYEKGTKTFTIDLTDDDIMASDAYYVMPNDIIYVRPMKIKAFKTRSSDVLTVMGFITSTLTTVLLVVNLNK